MYAFVYETPSGGTAVEGDYCVKNRNLQLSRRHDCPRRLRRPLVWIAVGQAMPNGTKSRPGHCVGSVLGHLDCSRAHGHRPTAGRPRAEKETCLMDHHSCLKTPHIIQGFPLSAGHNFNLDCGSGQLLLYSLTRLAVGLLKDDNTADAFL